MVGFKEYATSAFIARLDDTLAIDSLDDLAAMYDDDEYHELGISKEDAAKISKAAQVEIVRRFLTEIPHANGTITGFYSRYAQALHDSGFEDVEDIEDIDDDDADELGLSKEEIRLLARKAEETQTRQTFRWLLTSYRDANGTFPFREEHVHSRMLEALISAGLRSLEDLGRMSANGVPGISQDELLQLQSAPLVLSELQKQEL
ncbi:MAG: hypothetical protein SGPRY_003562 [Prymnesium sp.]